MRIEDFLSRLERVKRSGSGWIARCPAHEDRSPSLSINEGDERIVTFCHAGCEQDDVLAALGLSWKDIVYDPEPETIYQYTDEHGNLLYEVLRYPGKRFKQRLANGEWTLGDVRRVLYRLPEVIYGVEQGKTIYICEGEKDVEALRSHGKIATTTAGGAQSWRPEFAEFLRGAKVIICQDKDEPGRERAAAISASLREVAQSVHIVEALEGKDVYDHLITHRHPLESLRTAPVASQRGVIKSIKDFRASLKPRNAHLDYLGPFLHGGERVHVAGPTGHGKTTFMLEAESAALRGDDFLGWTGRGDLRALHIDLEMPEHLLDRAVRHARIEHGLDILHEPDGLEIDKNASHRQMIEKAVEGYDIVCIDPWYKLVGNELEYSSVRAVIGLLDGLRQKHARMCLLVGFHTQEPYTKDQRLGMASISGFKSWHKPADIVLTFQRTGGNFSRVVWAKDRPGRLNVSIDEEWSLEWTRGYGFERIFELSDTHIPGVIGS